MRIYILGVKEMFILLITALAKEKLQLCQKMLVKTVKVKKRSGFFQSIKKLIYFFIIHVRRYILQNFFYY